MRVAVVVAGVGGGGHFFDGDHATLRYSAVFMLELDGGVADVEVGFEDAIQVCEDAEAFGGRDVGNGDVAGQGAGLRTERPAVEVVNVENSGDGLHVVADVIEVDAAGGAFKEDLEGFADNAPRRPQDERGDDEG